MALKDKVSTVQRAIESVLNQTIKNFELIVVDGSTDRGPDLIRSYNDNRIIIVSEGDGGVGAARNMGIRMAKADLVAFLDADDEYYPNYLEIAIKMEKKYPEAFAYYQRFEIVDKDGCKKVPKMRYKEKEQIEGYVERYFYTISEGGVPMTTSSVVIRRTLLLALGGFKENIWYGEDTDLWAESRYFIKLLSIPISERFITGTPQTGFRIDTIIQENMFSSQNWKKVLMDNNYGSHERDDIKEYIVKLKIFISIPKSSR